MTATYVADAPGDGALFARSRSLVGLALDAEVHDVITTDGAVVDNNVPSPESYSVPLRSVNNQPVRSRPHLLLLETGRSRAVRGTRAPTAKPVRRRR